MTVGLRTKIFLPLLLSGLLLASYLYGYWMPRLLADAENSYQSSLSSHLDSVAEGLVPLLLGKQLDAIYGNLDALLKKNENWASIELFDPQGRLLYPLDAPTASKRHKDDDVRILKQDIRYLDTNLGDLVVKVSLTEKLDVIRRDYVRLFYLLFIVMFLFFLTTGFILELLVRRPIKHLADASQRLAEGDFGMPLPATGNDEIGTLMKSFVAMRDAISLNTGKLSDANEQLRLEVKERKQAEEVIREHSAQIEAVNRELESFAYVVSHDLKAPLRAITSLSSWLDADYGDKLDEQGRESLGLLVQRAKRMNSLIDGILQYSRVGRVKEGMKLTDLNEVVKDVIDLLSAPAGVTVTIETELPTLLCEKTRIYQVFQNLISNAVKHLDKPEGVIRIGCVDSSELGVQCSEKVESGVGSSEFGDTPLSPPLIRGEDRKIPLNPPLLKGEVNQSPPLEKGGQGGFKSENYYTFYVSDNGPGIEEKYFDKIFQMFQTLKPRDEVENTGVGLTIVKKIVEMYGGKIWLESKLGEGSTFWFTLPKREHGGAGGDAAVRTTGGGHA